MRDWVGEPGSRQRRRAPGGPALRAEVLRFRQVWGLIAAKFLSEAAWYFFIFWLPKYLGDVRHLDIKQIGYYAWIPYACAGAGSLVGGGLSSWLMTRGCTLDRARKIALGTSAALMPVSLAITGAPLALAIAFFGLAMFAHQFWSTIVQTLAADLFPPRAVGTVAGLMGAAGSFGTVLFTLGVGAWFAGPQSYGTLFVIAGLLHPASFLLILAIVRRIEPVAVTAARGSPK
ncbi:MAG: MFS transporter [Verrucomicrobia bacterium]|nr:MFS transporter [Verrucomicrobiota bacterium]